jgi:hypothetical protein
LSEIIDNANITEEESNKLQHAWLELQAYRNIVLDVKTMQLAANGDFSNNLADKITTGWTNAQMKFDKTWSDLRYKYFFNKYESSEYKCQCNFNNKEIVIIRA